MTSPEEQGALRYTRVAIVLHWLIAGFIVFNLSLGFFMEGFAPPLKMAVVGLHVSSGMSVLVLSMVRVLWRLTHRPPEHTPPLQGWEAGASHIVHFLLYGAMVLMPLSGWAILSSHPAPGTAGFAAEQAAMPAPPAGVKRPPAGGGIQVWWIASLPSLGPVQNIGAEPGGLPAQKALHDDLAAWHSLGGWIMIALLVLHIGGALKHQYIDRMRLLQRMTWSK